MNEQAVRSTDLGELVVTLFDNARTLTDDPVEQLRLTTSAVNHLIWRTRLPAVTSKQVVHGS
jgi:hypothetical protein